METKSWKGIDFEEIRLGLYQISYWRCSRCAALMKLHDLDLIVHAEYHFKN